MCMIPTLIEREEKCENEYCYVNMGDLGCSAFGSREEIINCDCRNSYLEKEKKDIPQIIRLLDMITESTTCKKCNRQIWFVKNRKTGKLNPITDEGLNHFIDCKYRFSCYESNRDVLTQIYDPQGNALTMGNIVDFLNDYESINNKRKNG